MTTVTESVFTLTLADTAYLIPAEAVEDRQYLVIYNGSGQTIFTGGATVTTSNGLPIADGKYKVIPASDGVYAVCGSAGKSIRIEELS